LVDRAISFSETEYLLFTDDDCLPKSPYWINYMAAEWEKGADIVVGYSPYEKQEGILNLLYRFETYTLGLQFLTAGIQKLPYMALGRNMGYTKTFYYAVNGMESINGYKGGDDDLLTNKGAEDAKWGFAINPDALVFSEPVHSFKAWQNQKLRHFKAGTRYDFYTLIKKQSKDKSKVKDTLGNIIDIDLKDLDFLPNYNIDNVLKLMPSKNDKICELGAFDDEQKKYSNDSCLLFSRSAYGTDKKWVSDRENGNNGEKFKYPLIHTTPKDGPRYMYSNTDSNGVSPTITTALIITDNFKPLGIDKVRM
jgi:hypothetical protein